MSPHRVTLLTLVAACSNLTGDANGVVAIEIRAPAIPIIEVGDTARLSAQAIDGAGDTVAVTFRWRTPDTTLIVVDSLAGLVTNQAASGSGRVQALYGDFTSDFVTYTIVPRADTLVVRPDTLTVLKDSAASPPLVALDSSAAEGALSGRRLVYLVVSPVDSSVELSGIGQVLAATSGFDGTPSPPVTLDRVPGRPSPAQAAVEVRSYRPSGLLVPGSGQQFTVKFEN